ncbi:MAG: immunoglobulin-like domain-containing protein, partial [Culicoidibacterales bacterium]
IITYTATDSDNNETTVNRNVTVTNELPVIEGLSELTIRQGQSVDLKDGVSANDLEDGVITDRIVYPTTDTATLAVGTHTLEYTVTDSDGNTTLKQRMIIVLAAEMPPVTETKPTPPTSDQNSSNKLPNTGAFGSELMILGGGILSMLGAVASKKRKNKK